MPVSAPTPAAWRYSPQSFLPHPSSATSPPITTPIGALSSPASMAARIRALNEPQPCVTQFPLTHDGDRIPSKPAMPFQQGLNDSLLVHHLNGPAINYFSRCKGRQRENRSL